MRETGLGLVGTHLCLTGLAPLAPPAAAHEGRRHPVADRPASHLGAYRDDDTDQLVTGDVRECYPVVMSCPCVPVTATETGRVHFDDHAPGRWRRIGDRPDVDRTTELLEHRCAHEAILPRASAASRPNSWYPQMLRSNGDVVDTLIDRLSPVIHDQPSSHPRSARLLITG